MQIQLEEVSYTYQPGTALAVDALRAVDLSVEQTDLLAVAGPTGSGKSTLIQVLAGLLAPSSGTLLVDGEDLGSSSRRRMRGTVGLVFQFPENQLFEATVAEDVAFGPRNIGIRGREVADRVGWALEKVGLDEQSFGPRNPFELSGGEKRRVAIAGVLAMRPKILILDEPTAGLDPAGKRDLIRVLRELHVRQGMGVVIVSHALDEVAEIIRRLVILRQGEIVFDGRPSVALQREELLVRSGLDLPQAASVARELIACGWSLKPSVVTRDDLIEAILSGGKKGGGA